MTIFDTMKRFHEAKAVLIKLRSGAISKEEIDQSFVRARDAIKKRSAALVELAKTIKGNKA